MQPRFVCTPWVHECVARSSVIEVQPQVRLAEFVDGVVPGPGMEVDG